MLISIYDSRINLSTSKMICERPKYLICGENCEKLHFGSPKIDKKVYHLLMSSCPIFTPFKYMIDTGFLILNLKFH